MVVVEKFSIQNRFFGIIWKTILVNRRFCSMRFLPVFFDLSRGSVVLIGSGAPAIAKLRLLRAAGANVRWFSQSADAGGELIHARHYAGTIEILAGEPVEKDLAGAFAIVSSAGKDIDERVARHAHTLNIPVNIVDRPDLSTLHLSCRCRPRRRGGRDLHWRCVAGAGAPAARKDRNHPSRAYRRICRLDADLSRAFG